MEDVSFNNMARPKAQARKVHGDEHSEGDMAEGIVNERSHRSAKKKARDAQLPSHVVEL